MQVVIDALNWICGLGPMCMMPIIMFVIGICLRVKIGTLLKCCITTGVGFCGVNLVINTLLFPNSHFEIVCLVTYTESASCC